MKTIHDSKSEAENSKSCKNTSGNHSNTNMISSNGLPVRSHELGIIHLGLMEPEVAIFGQDSVAGEDLLIGFD